jgi:ribosomal protein S11
MAKPAAAKTKKKIKRIVTDGIAHVHASFNNTIITITGLSRAKAIWQEEHLTLWDVRCVRNDP